MKESQILALLEQCRQWVGVSQRVQLIETGAVSSPALYGLLRPCLLMPTGSLEAFTDKELRLIFLHELAHLRRKDLWVHGVAGLACCLHWFNPLVWMAARRAGSDRELACDGLVLALTLREEHRLYGRTIVKLLEGVPLRPRQSAGLVGILENVDQLERRIRMMTLFRKSKIASALALLLLAALCVVSLTDAHSAPSGSAAVPRTVAAGLDTAAREAALRTFQEHGATITYQEGETGKVRQITFAWPSFRNESDAALLPLFPEMSALTLQGEGLTDAGLAAVASLSRLEDLGVVSSRITDAGLNHLRGLTNLTRIGAEGSSLTDGAFSVVTNYPKLQQLVLVGSTNMTDRGLSQLGTLTNITSFNVWGVRATDAGASVMTNFPKLSWVYLVGDGFTDQTFGFLRDCTALTGLCVHSTNLTPGCLNHIQRLTNLTTFIPGSLAASDDELRLLEPLSNLEYLQGIRITNVTSRGLASLARLSRLKHLFLGRQPIGDAGLAQLAHLTNLVWLDIGAAGVTDKG